MPDAGADPAAPPKLRGPTSLPTIGQGKPKLTTAAKRPLPDDPPALPPRAPDGHEESRVEMLSEENMPPTSAARERSGTTTNLLQPTIEVRHEMPNVLKRGEPIPIRVILTNRGATAVDRVVVTDELGPDLELLSASPKADRASGTLVWALGSLEAGEEKVIELAVSARAAATNPRVQNNATVSFQTTSRRSAAVCAPKLALSVQGPPSALVGETVHYAIEVKNVGDAAAQEAVLRDPLPDGLEHPHGPELENDIGDLAPGETRTIPLSLTATKEGSVVNRVSVVAAGVEEATVEVPLTIQEVKLALENQGPKVRYLNRPCTYELSVHNPGTTEARDVRLVTTLPAGVGFVHASQDGKHDAVAHAVAWTIGSLKPSETRTIALTGMANELGEQPFHATLTAANQFRQESNWTTTVQGVSALQVEVLDVDDPIEVGSEGIYEIRVINQGSIPATNVRVHATLPKELEAIAADGPTSQTLADQVLRFEPIDKLAPKADATFRVKVRGTAKGDCRFQASVTTDQLSRPVVKEESTTVFSDL